jgi:hypothetical protein
MATFMVAQHGDFIAMLRSCAVDPSRVGEEWLMIEILLSRSLYVKSFQWRIFWRVKARRGEARRGELKDLMAS